MKVKSNSKVRAELARNGLFIWQLAEVVGVHETTMTKWLRTPLNEEQQKRVDRALNRLIEESKAVNA